MSCITECLSIVHKKYAQENKDLVRYTEAFPMSRPGSWARRVDTECRKSRESHQAPLCSAQPLFNVFELDKGPAKLLSGLPLSPVLETTILEDETRLEANMYCNCIPKRDTDAFVCRMLN